MTMEPLWNYPTLMCTPPAKAGGVLPTETLLTLEPDAYAVTQEDGIWKVTVKHSGEVLYVGPGPVELMESPAPF